MRLMNSFELKRWLSYLLLILAAIVSYAALNNLSQVTAWFSRAMAVFSPFLAGVVIAYLLDIPTSSLVARLERAKHAFVRSKARILSILAVYVVFVAIIVILMSIIIPEIVRTTVEFVAGLPGYYERIRVFLLDLSQNDAVVNQFDWESIQRSITVSSVLEAFSIKNLGISSVWQSLLGILSVSSYLINIFIAFISSIYILLESASIKRFGSKLLMAFIPDKTAAIFTKYLKHTNENFKKFVYCTILDGAVIGGASVVILSVFGVRYAIVLGIVEGVTNMIPYFGAIVGTVLVSVIVLFVDGPGKALLTLLALFILQQIDGNIIKPKLFGDSFNISPFLVIVSITIGGSYYGVMGMVVAIPLVAVFKNMINDFLDYRISIKNGAVYPEEDGGPV